MFIISVVRLQLSSNLNNVYIKHPVSLEQYIMEGSYAEAGRMLNLSGSEMTEFARKREWKVMGERFVFRSEAKQEEGGVPSLELANMVISYAREMDEYTPHPTGGVLAGELNKDLVILENNIPVVGSANLEVEIMSSNIPTISRSRECTVCTSGHKNDKKMRNVQSVLAVMRMIG